MISLTLAPGMSITEAIANIPNTQPVQVTLEKGEYQEKVWIRRNNVSVIGSGNRESILSFSDYNDKLHKDGRPFNTFRTPTLTITSDEVTLSNLTIVNDAGHGKGIGQAVACALYGDKTRLTQCTILGYQDTLFLGPLPKDLTNRYLDLLPEELLHQRPLNHLFIDCTIGGSVDYIFGSATALFQTCCLISQLPGYIAAPSTYEENPIGFVFWNCQILNRSGTNQVFLARPWREHGYVYYHGCRFEGEIHSVRYDDWGKHKYRFYEDPLIPSPMSRDLSKERIKQIKQYFEESFQIILSD